MTRILEIGVCSERSHAIDPEQEFRNIPDKEITTVDIDAALSPDLIHDIRQPFPDEYREAFDIVLCSHVLEHIEYNQVIYAALNMAQCLKVGGKLMLVVPSLEWACRRALTTGVDGVAWAVLYGGQANDYDYHRSGFTLRWIRNTFAELGFVELDSKAMRFHVIYADDSGEVTTPALQNVYVGKKVTRVELEGDDDT